MAYSIVRAMLTVFEVPSGALWSFFAACTVTTLLLIGRRPVIAGSVLIAGFLGGAVTASIFTLGVFLSPTKDVQGPLLIWFVSTPVLSAVGAGASVLLASLRLSLVR